MKPLRALTSLLVAAAVLSVVALSALAGVGVAAHEAWAALLFGWHLFS